MHVHIPHIRQLNLQMLHAEVSWNALENAADINIRLEQFNKVFHDPHAPVKLMSFKHRASPFISPEIKYQMKVRDTYLRNARRTRCNTDWALFKRTQIEVKKIIAEAENGLWIKKLCKTRTIVMPFGKLFGVIRQISKGNL